MICFFLVSFSYTHTAPRKHSLVLLLVQEHAPPRKGKDGTQGGEEEKNDRGESWLI